MNSVCCDIVSCIVYYSVLFEPDRKLNEVNDGGEKIYCLYIRSSLRVSVYAKSRKRTKSCIYSFIIIA